MDSLSQIIRTTKETKKEYAKARKQYLHWKRKSEETGENHSQSKKR